jgi:hypothetical protein
VLIDNREGKETKDREWKGREKEREEKGRTGGKRSKGEKKDIPCLMNINILSIGRIISDLSSMPGTVGVLHERVAAWVAP